MRESIRYRPATEEDLPFLFALYASTRADEMRMVQWNDGEKLAFLEMQFRAQKSHYEEFYSDAEHLVIEKDGAPIGRLYIDRAPEDIRIVDIALLPEARGGGIGTMLLREILDEAAASSRVVSIHVEIYNPAKHLYERLGFQYVETTGIYQLMKWRAAT